MKHSIRPEPISGTCPQCGSTQIESGPAFSPFVAREARSVPRYVDGMALTQPIESHAANPPSIRCVGCNSKWGDLSEIDPTSERFAFLRSQYTQAQAT